MQTLRQDHAKNSKIYEGPAKEELCGITKISKLSEFVIQFQIHALTNIIRFCRVEVLYF